MSSNSSNSEINVPPGYILHEVPRNGTCFFRSVLEAVHYPERVRNINQTILELKRNIQEYVCGNGIGNYINFFAVDTTRSAAGSAHRAADAVTSEVYCSRTSPLFKQTFYAGNIEVDAAAKVLGITIVVHDDRGNGARNAKTHHPKRGVTPLKTVHLFYNNGNHYDWLEKIPSSSSSSASSMLISNSNSNSNSSVSSSTKRHTRSNTQANTITRRYLTTLGLQESMLPAIREQLRTTSFGNNHRQFLRNHNYNSAANNSNSLVLAHMVRAHHQHLANRKM